MAAGEERRRIAVLSRVGRVQRRLNLEVWLNALVAPLWVGVTLLVIGRVFLPVGFEVLAVGLVLLVATLTTVQARPRRVSISQAAVIADRQAGSGGLLLTRLETAVGEWELGLNQQLKTLPMPKVDLRTSGRWLTFALLFAVAGFWVPRVHYAHKTTNAAAASRVDQLADKVEALAKEEAVPEAIEAELARLQAEVEQGAFNATDWEAADSLEKALNEKAAETAGDLSNAERAAENLAKSLAQSQTGERAAEDRAKLEEALMKLGEGTQGKQPSEAKPTESPSSSASAESLKEALAKRREALAKSFGQKPGTAQGAPKPGEGKKKGTGEKGEGKGDGEGKGQGQSDGDGHASRKVMKGGGPAHGDAPPAELVFGGEANIDPDRLKFEPLPEGHGGDEPGELLGLRAANPHAPDDVPRSAATGATATGDQAAGHREGPLLPRNRALIERYFQSK